MVHINKIFIFSLSSLSLSEIKDWQVDSLDVTQSLVTVCPLWHNFFLILIQDKDMHISTYWTFLKCEYMQQYNGSYRMTFSFQLFSIKWSGSIGGKVHIQVSVQVEPGYSWYTNVDSVPLPNSTVILLFFSNQTKSKYFF